MNPDMPRTLLALTLGLSLAACAGDVESDDPAPEETGVA